MTGFITHFGCRISHPEDAKLTRENYAPINKRTRKNSFLPNRSLYSDLDVEEANNFYWEKFKNHELYQYNKSMERFLSYCDELKDDADYRETELKNYIEQQINKRIEDEKWRNRVFFIESKDTEEISFGKKYAEILEKNSVDGNYSDEIKERFNKFQQDLKNIKEYTLSDMLWFKSPTLWKEWKRDNNKNKGFEIPDEWFKEFAMRKAPYYTDEKCKILQERALKNYDANIQYFKSLDSNKFNTEIDLFLKNHPRFEIVDDLNKHQKTSGIYIMILDEYKQIYIGLTRSKTGIKGRIQSHWSNVMPLDRLIWGSEEYSILSIDSFRAFDTTRILIEPHSEFQKTAIDPFGNPKKEKFLGKICNVWEIDEYLQTEEFELINNSFSQEFLCNRCDGGGSSFLEAVVSRKGRPQLNK